jgi:hypothetical protein
MLNVGVWGALEGCDWRRRRGVCGQGPLLSTIASAATALGRSKPFQTAPNRSKPFCSSAPTRTCWTS